MRITIPKLAPMFDVTDIHGHRHPLSDYYGKKLTYKRYGVKHSLLTLVRGMLMSSPSILKGTALGVIPRLRSDHTFMPADLLVDKEGLFQWIHYGRAIGDHIPCTSIRSFIIGKGVT